MNYYPGRAIVDLDAIRDNVIRLRECAPTAQVMAVVKGDAYGHGLVPAARAALRGGATWLGAAQVPEALALRAAGITAPVLTWLYGPGAPLAQVIEADIDISAPAPWALAEIADAARATGRAARVHLKVDTGLARGGSFLEDWTAMLHDAVRWQADGVVTVVGVWSHLARADEVDHPSVLDQFDVFAEAVRRAEAAGAALEVRHLANSAATISVPQVHYDLVRPGIAVYGLSPMPVTHPSAEVGLVPAMRLEADLHVVKDAGPGQGVSYGHTYTTSYPTTLATVPLGYADGIPRRASNVGPVQVAGHQVRIAGRVCMDQFVLDVRDLPVSAGDTAVLFGNGSAGEPTAQDWADAVGGISYEIVTQIGPRVPRIYRGEGA
ncbi:alanine racemase [Ruania halotolerans]|uniref:alanine racemase n=1 Tax=Ruania halotolerans TaxID=2897773 RepID=UPI001E39A893|nr:alanine racemase [Ruania halotolerans]UFU05703.1 alanine racemase [Ruania halotolerans]